MRGEDLRQSLPLALNHEALVVEGVVAFLADELRDVGVFQKELVKPGDLGKNLQVGEILRQKELLRLLGRVTRVAESLPEFAVARVASDQVDRIRLKEILQGEAALFEAQVAGGPGRDLEEWVLGGPRDVVLDLGDERGHQVKVLVNLREFIQELDHAIVVLQGMQAYPGKPVLAGDQILIEGLVLMP